jgi:hypothetical protein
MLLTRNFSADEQKKKIHNKVLLRLNSTAMYENCEIVDHYKILFNQLMAMGFMPRIINNCFRLYRFMNLSEAIELLIKEKGKYVHKFIQKDDHIIFVKKH